MGYLGWAIGAGRNKQNLSDYSSPLEILPRIQALTQRPLRPPQIYTRIHADIGTRDRWVRSAEGGGDIDVPAWPFQDALQALIHYVEDPGLGMRIQSVLGDGFKEGSVGVGGRMVTCAGGALGGLEGDRHVRFQQTNNKEHKVMVVSTVTSCLPILFLGAQ